MKQRLFVVAILVVLGIAAGVQAADWTNVVLIMVDDMGAECLASYGGESYETPHLDALAGEGLRFTHCYSQPLCTPSRVKIMTGQSNARNYTHFSILEPGEWTFGHMLRDTGYRTGVVGKWQLYGTENYGELTGKGSRPQDAGFDEYCLWQIERRESRYWQPVIDRNGEYLDVSEDTYGPEVFTDWACDFIDDHREQPFFLYFPMALVHDPFLPTPLSDDRQSKDRAANFADMVTYMDHVVGRIVNQLKESGLAENTLVLYTSDNGTHPSISSKQHGNSVQGGKRLPTHAGMHVPLIAWQPGTVPAGESCNDLVDFADFVPTIADVTGASVKGRTLDGRSFAPQLNGKRGRPREWLYCWYHAGPRKTKNAPVWFAWDREYKLYHDNRFFHIEADRLESHPLHPGKLDAHAAAAYLKLKLALENSPRR